MMMSGSFPPAMIKVAVAMALRSLSCMMRSLVLRLRRRRRAVLVHEVQESVLSVGNGQTLSFGRRRFQLAFDERLVIRHGGSQSWR